MGLCSSYQHCNIISAMLQSPWENVVLRNAPALGICTVPEQTRYIVRTTTCSWSLFITPALIAWWCASWRFIPWYNGLLNPETNGVFPMRPKKTSLHRNTTDIKWDYNIKHDDPAQCTALNHWFVVKMIRYKIWNLSKIYQLSHIMKIAYFLLRPLMFLCVFSPLQALWL